MTCVEPAIRRSGTIDRHRKDTDIGHQDFVLYAGLLASLGRLCGACTESPLLRCSLHPRDDWRIPLRIQAVIWVSTRVLRVRQRIWVLIRCNNVTQGTTLQLFEPRLFAFLLRQALFSKRGPLFPLKAEARAIRKHIGERRTGTKTGSPMARVRLRKPNLRRNWITEVGSS